MADKFKPGLSVSDDGGDGIWRYVGQRLNTPSKRKRFKKILKGLSDEDVKGMSAPQLMLKVSRQVEKTEKKRSDSPTLLEVAKRGGASRLSTGPAELMKWLDGVLR